MYEINVSTRRVTQFIIEEAYRWLYIKINNNEYQANRCKEGKSLMVKVAEDKTVTPENYEAFIKLFDNSPVAYMMYRSKRKSSKMITTDILCNYFVKYNGHVLPVGFIKDFFEDDYETQQEVNALLEGFTKNAKSEISVQWRRMLLNQDDSIDKLKEVYSGMLKLHPMLLITQIIRLVITGAMTFLCVFCLNSIYFFEVMKVFITKLKFDFDAGIKAKELMDAYCIGDEVFCLKNHSFTMLEYLTKYGIFLAICLLLVIILISRYKQLISFLLFLGRMIVCNIKLLRVKLAIGRFEKNGLDKIGTYFDEIAPDMVSGGVIEDAHCSGIPADKGALNLVNKFDSKKLAGKFAAQITKYSGKHFTYDARTLDQAKRSWRKGLVSSTIFTILFALVLVPSLYTLIMTYVSGMF